MIRHGMVSFLLSIVFFLIGVVDRLLLPLVDKLPDEPVKWDELLEILNRLYKVYYLKPWVNIEVPKRVLSVLKELMEAYDDWLD